MGYFDDKVVVVTGSASGIGEAVAAVLQSAGSTVIGIDKDHPVSASDVTLRVDLTIEAEIVKAFALIQRHHARIDVLINCAGVYPVEQASSNFDPAEFDRIFSINVKAAMLVTREALPLMDRGGRIINLASDLAFLGRDGAPIYSASKGALVSLTRAWARELAPKILVNAVAPGATDTPMLRWDKLTQKEKDEETDNLLHRVATPREVAEAIMFLAGEWSTHTTGQILSVDGGATMH